VLIHQHLDHVVTADIDDERHPRTKRGDVRKILFRRHAEIDATGLHAADQVGE
jgi:hypothetical protein